MPTVEYLHSFPYKRIPGPGLAPAVEVALHYGGRRVPAVAVLDSGATLTVFNREHAEILGIDITAGRLERIRTGGGPFECYMFDLEIELRAGNYTGRFPAQVGFAAGRIPRNILGRVVFFTRYEIGFRESQQMIHIRPEHQD